MEVIRLFLPELACLAMAFLLFCLSMIRVRPGFLWRASLVSGLVVVASATYALGSNGNPFFEGIYRVDLFSQVVKLGLAVGLTLVIFLTDRVATVSASDRMDVPMLLFVSTVGMMMLASATELVTFYVALELTAYPLYALVAIQRRRAYGREAALKYVLQGTLASASTLYGISLLFGVLRSTYFVDLVAAPPETLSQPLTLVALLLVLSGVLYKLAVFPFHFWAPDVYEAAPHPVVAFIASVSKLAAVAVLCRLVSLIPPDSPRFVGILLLLCVVSMTLGNLAALVQRDLKRLLAWSTVAHAGYLLLGILALTELGLGAALFYGLLYLLLAYSCFLVVCVLGRDGKNPDFDTISGLHRRSPILALLLVVGVFGLAGIPPTPGFVGKWFLFSAALDQGYFWLVLVAAVNSTLALYYYLQVARKAYLEDPVDDKGVPVSPAAVVVALALLLAIVALGVYPGPLWDLTQQAAASLFI